MFLLAANSTAADQPCFQSPYHHLLGAVLENSCAGAKSFVTVAGPRAPDLILFFGACCCRAGEHHPMPFESSSSAHGAGMCLRCKGMRIITIAMVNLISINVRDGLKMRNFHQRRGRVVWLCHHYLPLNVQYVIVVLGRWRRRASASVTAAWLT